MLPSKASVWYQTWVSLLSKLPKHKNNYFLESNLGPHSCRVECPECNTHVLSTTTSSPGVKAWVTGIVLCLCG